MGWEAEERNMDEALLKAWNFYLIAAQANNKKGLLALERIGPNVSRIDNNIVVALEIGKIYQHVVQDNLNALSWYLSGDDPNNADLNNALQVLVQSDAECTYRIGLHYLDKGGKERLGDLYNQRQFLFFDPRAAARWHEKASEDNRSSQNASYS